MNKIKISRIQEQFWLLQKLYADSTAYNVPSILRIEGKLNILALNNAFNHIIKRHEILKSFYTEQDSQVFEDHVEDENSFYSISEETIPEIVNCNDLPKQILDEINTPFILDSWPLFRIKLFKEAEDKFILTIIFHHIIIDLYSKNIFAKELSDYYAIFNENIDYTEIFPIDRYSDYSNWFQKWVSSTEAKTLITSWKEQMIDPPGNLEFPVDFPTPLVNSLEGKRLQFELNPADSFAIHQLAIEYHVNDFTILLSAYVMLLCHLTNQNRISIGVPFTNRKNELFKDVFGCFVNIVPIFLDIEKDDSIGKLIHKVRKQLLLAHRRQEIPFLNINELFRATNGGNTKNIFQAGFTFEPPLQLDLYNCTTEAIIISKDGAQLDLFLTMWQQRDHLFGFLECSSQKFSQRTMFRFKEIYLKIIEAFVNRTNSSVFDISILPDSDRQLIELWNDTQALYSQNICLHHRFEMQADKTPDAVALLFGNQFLTYAEVDKFANQFANFLIDHGTGIEDKIGVCQERSLEMLICILGIHKAGATYVPLDPDYPSDRMCMILEDACPKYIIIKNGSGNNIPDAFSKIYVDGLLSKPISENSDRPVINISSHNLAYIIYTSGSTGKPKGVMIEHHSVINKLEWMQVQHPINKDDTLIMKTPVTFDVSIWEIFWWFFNGARLAILPPKGEKDPKTIIDVVEKYKVTLIIFVPSMFSSFLGYMIAYESTNMLKSLKWIVQIGEVLSPQLVNSFNELRNEVFAPVIVNTYGPAEATVAVSYYNCPVHGVIENVFIGKPIFNTKILIVNCNNKILPIGIPGELVITGVNVARGYINRPELNTQKFIEIEYFHGENLRAYKTGDLARWVDNGNLDFIGRVDNQVKIRGYRIELGDIEAVLQQCPIVNAAAVIVDSSIPDNKFLIGYVTLKDKSYGTIDMLKGFLQKKLPDYMIPAHLFILENMPLNQSEKIDRKALPKPALIHKKINITASSFYEIQLLKIWNKLLNFEDIGLLDNFFEIGGNSLIAINITNAIKMDCDISIKPVKLMEYPTIRDLSDYMNSILKISKNIDVKPVTSQKVRKQDFSLVRNRRMR